MNKYFNPCKPCKFVKDYKNKTLHINFRENYQLYEQIKVYAKFYGISCSAFVKGCVEEYVRGDK